MTTRIMTANARVAQAAPVAQPAPCVTQRERFPVNVVISVRVSVVSLNAYVVSSVIFFVAKMVIQMEILEILMVVILVMVIQLVEFLAAVLLMMILPVVDHPLMTTAEAEMTLNLRVFICDEIYLESHPMSPFLTKSVRYAVFST